MGTPDEELQPVALVIDDEEVDLIRMQRWLSPDFDVRVAKTVDQGLELLYSARPDLTFLDNRLGEHRGLDLLPIFERAGACVVFMTAYGDERTAAAAIKAGAIDYLPKGELDRDVLIRAAEAAMRHAADRRQLNACERRFQEVVESLDQIFWLTDCKQNKLLYCSTSFREFWGVRGMRLWDDPMNWITAVAQEDRELVRERYANSIETGRPFEMDLRLSSRPATQRWIRCSCHPLLGSDGEVERMAGFAREVTDAKAQEKKLITLARELEVVADDAAQIRHKEQRLQALTRELQDQVQTDSLTGLANRRGLETALTRELGRASRGGQSIAAIMIDIDDFKALNDDLGHASGDQILREVAGRMLEILRPSDVLARVGGDEFVVLLPETRLPEAAQVAERLRLAVESDPLDLGRQTPVITASLGVAMVPHETVSLQELFDVTREVLRQSKRQGKNTVVSATDAEGHPTFTPVTDVDVERLTTEGAIRAVKQSIRDLASGDVIGYECLSRGPEGAYESPTAFFHLSREKDVLTHVDLHCLRVCVEAAARVDAGLDVHVNLHPATLVDTPVARILDLMRRADGGPERFCVEISEQQFLGAPLYLVEPVHELRAAGVRLAIDNVGFGRSSIEALVVLEPDAIKIARDFVRGADAHEGRRRGLERLVRASATLSSRLIAEGVETEAERDLLLGMGVRYGQGFLWDRPDEVRPAARVR